MSTEKTFPKTLVQAVNYFADLDTAQRFFIGIRWPGGVTCPKCGCKDAHYLANQRRWKCRNKHPQQQFSAKVGTVFEDSPLGLDKWLVVVWLEVNAKNSVSSYEIHRALGVTQKSAWFMLHRVRAALEQGSFEKLGGPGEIVETDETYVGGKVHNMSLSKRKAYKLAGKNAGSDKICVAGYIQRRTDKRASRVRAKNVGSPTWDNLVPGIYNNVELGSKLYTDALTMYRDLATDYVHGSVDHREAYVDGPIHTNGMENFWALFKRCIKGTHVSIDPAHLQRYIDSEVFRFNNRETNDGERLRLALAGVTGKRLTYKALIGVLERRAGSDKDAGDAGAVS